MWDSLFPGQPRPPRRSAHKLPTRRDRLGSASAASSFSSSAPASATFPAVSPPSASTATCASTGAVAPETIKTADIASAAAHLPSATSESVSVDTPLAPTPASVFDTQEPSISDADAMNAASLSHTVNHGGQAPAAAIASARLAEMFADGARVPSPRFSGSPIVVAREGNEGGTLNDTFESEIDPDHVSTAVLHGSELPSLSVTVSQLVDALPSAESPAASPIVPVEEPFSEQMHALHGIRGSGNMIETLAPSFPDEIGEGTIPSFTAAALVDSSTPAESPHRSSQSAQVSGGAVNGAVDDDTGAHDLAVDTTGSGIAAPPMTVDAEDHEQSVAVALPCAAISVDNTGAGGDDNSHSLTTPSVAVSCLAPAAALFVTQTPTAPPTTLSHSSTELHPSLLTESGVSANSYPTGKLLALEVEFYPFLCCLPMQTLTFPHDSHIFYLSFSFTRPIHLSSQASANDQCSADSSFFCAWCAPIAHRR